ncbi:hypothetical protein [Mongoliibacter ruber]|uniref:Uncharacterized protein n=1 Tax=Mongoliibacter ruber TaxID=1750599 RepID=A0A2T0WV61_9BACT|nr:hypothetical protein [Mongoliibacter ruber]PRY90578.1 hypothetical protein CLW00_101241 [Mongoliibacter ruber]
MAANTENNNVLQDRYPERKEKELSLRTDEEKIVLHLQGKYPNSKLTPALEEKLNRLKRASELISKYGGAKKVIPILQEIYGISFSTANRLYKGAQDAFGDITHFNRPYHVDIYINKILEGINLAKDSGDFRSYAALLKEYKEAIKEFMGTNEDELYRRIVIPPFVVGFFPEELKTKLPPQASLDARIKKLLEEKRSDEIEDAIVLDTEDDDED